MLQVLGVQMFKVRVLVTGANGFIGRETVNDLKKSYGVKKFDGDVKDRSDWQENLVGGEIVFLIAGVRTETDTDFAVNAYSIENLFDAAIKLNKLPKKIILASTQAVYMGNAVPFKESQTPLPPTIYGQSKLLGEQIAYKWCQELKIPLVILRYSTVLGVGIKEKSKMSGPLYAWTKAALAGEPIKVFQDGKQSRDYIHINDIARANMLAVGLPEGVYNVGGGKQVKLLALAKWIKQATRSHSEIVIMGGEPSRSDPKEMFSDTKKIKSHGWKTQRSAKDAVFEFVASRLPLV